MLACSRRGHSETFKCSQMSSNVKRGKRNQIDLVFFRPVTFYIKGCRDQTTFYNRLRVAQLRIMSTCILENNRK